MNNNNSTSYCKFCKAKLNYGSDKDYMLHCQHCHNVWDGFSQCTCNLDDSNDDINDNEDKDKETTKNSNE